MLCWMFSEISQLCLYNALIHPYLNYAVLDWGRTSKIAIQTLVNVQNKAVKFLKTSNKATFEETHIQNHIGC